MMDDYMRISKTREDDTKGTVNVIQLCVIMLCDVDVWGRGFNYEESGIVWQLEDKVSEIRYNSGESLVAKAVEVG